MSGDTLIARVMRSSQLARLLLVDVTLVLATLAVFREVRDFALITYDDPAYVGNNSYVLGGLRMSSIVWSFTSMHAANWHPLTWISLMLDATLFGKEPGGFHVVNLALHVLNALLLFHVLQRLTGKLGRSAFAAALFAVHPLHVESVAWVSERKDVLSTMFMMLAMWAYLRYTERPILSRYLMMLLLFSLGLSAKPILVTLPLLLLLLDWWPLGRLTQHSKPGRRTSLIRLLLEKVPMLVLSGASSVVTVLAQARGGTMSTTEMLPLWVRGQNSLLSYVGYLSKTLWPTNLAFFYPHPGAVPFSKAGQAALILVALTALALLVVRRHPYALVGWLWYVGSLVPVIGVIQVGPQASADRYTYVPLIGLFLVMAWVFPELPDAPRWWRKALVVGSLAIVVTLSIIASRQVRYWRDSVTLYTHALSVTSNNFLAHNNLGNLFLGQAKLQQAAAEYEKALLIKPADAIVRYNLALALEGLIREREAAVQYEAALLSNPRLGEAHNNLGYILARRGRQREAIEHYREALRINPSNTGARFRLALSLQRIGMLEESVREYENVIRESPGDAEALNNLGAVLATMGRLREALPRFREAVRLAPANIEASRNLERVEREIAR